MIVKQLRIDVKKEKVCRIVKAPDVGEIPPSLDKKKAAETAEKKQRFFKMLDSGYKRQNKGS